MRRDMLLGRFRTAQRAVPTTSSMVVALLAGLDFYVQIVLRWR